MEKGAANVAVGRLVALASSAQVGGASVASASAKNTKTSALLSGMRVADDTAIDFDPFQVPLYRAPERGEVDAESLGLDAVRRSELLRSPGDEGDESDEGNQEETP